MIRQEAAGFEDSIPAALENALVLQLLMPAQTEQWAGIASDGQKELTEKARRRIWDPLMLYFIFTATYNIAIVLFPTHRWKN